MILLDHLLIDEAILHSSFACDLKQCRGACCTLPGGAGAPVADGEVDDMYAVIEQALPYLPERSRAILKEQGPIEGHAGAYATVCIDDKDCVFVYHEDGVAKCAIERAWLNKETSFRKPLSCHLFPIRVANFGGPYLHYEQFDECQPGRDLGERIGLPLIVALKDALVRAYGEELYERLLATARDEEDTA